MMRSYGGGPGLDYAFARFRPRLARELGDDLAQTIFVDNPARAFAFAPSDSGGPS
jgi:5-phospho-D-xylono-1,4-lactonase